MKIRTGFVSNSSSSSFVIDKKRLTSEQKKAFAELASNRECDFDIIESEDAFAAFSYSSVFDMSMFLRSFGISRDWVYGHVH